MHVIHKYMCISCVYVFARMYAHAYVIYACACGLALAYARTSTYIHAHTHRDIQRHACMHAYTHMHEHAYMRTLHACIRTLHVIGLHHIHKLIVYIYVKKLLMRVNA